MQGVCDHFEVEMIGQGDHDHVARGHRRDDLFVQLGKLFLWGLLQRWMRSEILFRKSFRELPAVCRWYKV
jgi:hypothetical protein